ncbi:MAG: phosphoribosylanthranilate isomerase [Bacteroidota bacterium]
MKHNTLAVAQLLPHYLGFIFYEDSPRHYEDTAQELPSEIKKVGVFVNADIQFISDKIHTFHLDVVQLHGEETPEFCHQLAQQSAVEIWKVFSIKDTFDFDRLTPYEAVVDKFLFDTKGKEKGGNGYTFDWSVLKEYTSSKPIVLSGGIGLEELPKLKEILTTELPIHVVDVNSRFEYSPGKKNIELLQKFIDTME